MIIIIYRMRLRQLDIILKKMLVMDQVILGQLILVNNLQPQVLVLASVEDGIVEDMQLQQLLAIIG